MTFEHQGETDGDEEPNPCSLQHLTIVGESRDLFFYSTFLLHDCRSMIWCGKMILTARVCLPSINSIS